jgi:hypothetical protein
MLFGTDVKLNINWKDFKFTKRDLNSYIRMAKIEIKEWERFLKLVEKKRSKLK